MRSNRVSGRAVATALVYANAERPTAAELRDLVVRAVLADPSNEDAQPLVLGLARAWEWASDLEREEAGSEDEAPALCQGSGAEDVFRFAYTRCGGDPDSAYYPDALPFDQPVPRWLLITLGEVIAARDAAEARALARYAAAQETP